jgi:hypothetical protein
MAEPFAFGATQATVNDSLPLVPDTEVGAPGVSPAIAAVVIAAAPSPFAFTALMRMLYEVPFANAVVPSELNVEITNGEAVVPAARVLNVVPPSVEYL